MTKEDWNRIKPILQEAQELPTDQQAAYLEIACANDDDLRRKVESFLSANISAVAYLDEPVFAFSEETEDLASSTIGPYLLESELGRGGSGVVYLARRVDASYKHQVAIKILKRGMDSDELIQRFRAEQQILANLDHPDIATIHDGGITADGRLYFIMEYIEGQLLNEFCVERGLGIGDRLRIFQRICAAVHVAHQNLVVHRDLKPSNILVTAEGNPKLLDFGIAKILDPNAPDFTTAVQRRLTPEYASPEQINGEMITTASDIYSLGVILYQFLSDRLPYTFTTRSDTEIRRIVCEQEPLFPSVAANRRHLRGDLDRIVLKAMRKEPRLRYVSAEQFSADIDRHVKGMPVIARRDTLLYRTIKFVRRNRFGIAIAAAVAILVFGFAVAMAYQQQITARQRDRAERVSDFLEKIFSSANPYYTGEEEISAKDLLDRGVESIERDLTEDASLRVALLKSMANAYAGLGLYEQSFPILQRTYELQEQLDPTNMIFVEVTSDLAEIHRASGRNEDAKKLYLQAIELARKLEGPSTELAASLNQLGITLKNMGQYEDAEQAYREGLTMREALVGTDHIDVASHLNDFGILLRILGKFDDAEEAYTRALRIKNQHYGDRHPRLVNTLNNLARLYRAREEFEKAEGTYRESLEIAESTLGSEHPEIAVVLNNLGVIFLNQGRYEDSEQVHRRALGIRLDRLGGDHPKTAESYHNLGAVKISQDRFLEAEGFFKNTLEIRRRTLGNQHPRIAATLDIMGKLYNRMERYREAEELFKEAFEIQRKARGEASRSTAFSMSSLAYNYFLQGRYTEAETFFLKVIRIAEDNGEGVSPNLGSYVHDLARLYLAQKRLEEAYPLLQRSISLEEERFGAGSRYLIPILKRHVSELRDLGREEEALDFEARVRELQQQSEAQEP